MKKTLYYDVVIEEYFQDYRMYNDGFIIVNLNEDGIINIEGVLTCDYLNAKMVDNKYVMKYYALQSNFKLAEELKIIIPKNKIELPINIGGEFNGGFVEIITTERIKDSETKKKYERRLEDFKEHSVFQEER